MRGRSDADLKHATRYLGGKSCVLVFDDLNFYVGRTDVAELEQVVAEQASICSIAVTCTTSTLPQVRSDEEPALSRFFSTLDQYEVLRMTDEQMEVLAADSAGRAGERGPHDCGGNPGLYLLDFRRLREEFQKLSHQEVAVVEAVYALFVAGISPIRVEQVRALASSGFGANLDIPTVSSALERLCSMSIIRESDPVLPEEAFLSEVVREEAVRARMDEVEEVLRELEDPGGLSQLGNTHYYGADFERASRVMRDVADLYRAADTPVGLVRAARALFNFGLALASWGRPEREIEVAYRDAAAAGREAATPEGLVEKARALSNLGNALVGWERPRQEIETTYHDAVAAGREAAHTGGVGRNSKGAVQLRAHPCDLGARPEQEVETAWRDAAAAGREAAKPEGLAETARALFNLGNAPCALGTTGARGRGRLPRCSGRGTRGRQTGRVGRNSEGAVGNLGNALVGWGRPEQEVEAAYRDAAAAGREAATFRQALVLAATGAVRPRNRPSCVGSGEGAERPCAVGDEEVEAAFHDAAAAGREAATPEGLVETAKALFNLGNALVGWGRPEQEVEAAYRDAAAAGRDAATSSRIGASGEGAVQPRERLVRWGREQEEVEAAFHDAAAAGREAATPEGLVETATALFSLGIVFTDWGRPEQEVEAAYRDAAATGREAANPAGLVLTARALYNLGIALAGWGREQEEVEAAYRDAAAQDARLQNRRGW